MKKLFTFFAVLAMATSLTAQTPKENLLKDWERARAYTKEYLEAMPETGYALKPTKEMRSFAGQMLHIADANYGIVGTATEVAPTVKDLEKSNELFAALFGKSHYKTEEVESEGVKTSFFQLGSNKVELLEGTNENSPISKFIEKKGEGVHHIAFAVDDILSEVARLKEAGFMVLNEIPKKGADNKLVVFLHPKSTNGVLIELCQEIG